jgi:predicted MFS family arabinose efflux permease
MGYIMAAMTLAMVAGPLVGGYITDSLSWRWIFYINMPIGGAALVYLALTLHVPLHKVKHKIDYLGAALLTVAASSLVLLTTWGGTQYPWRSAQIMGLGAVAVAATAGFIAAERRAAEPVIPLHVFRNRNFSLVAAMSFLLGLALFGAITFLPLYQQTVQHLSATESGLMLIPLLIGSTVTALIAGRITTRTGRYKALPIIGGGVMTVGMYLLTRLGLHTSLVIAGLYFAVLGLGMGFLMQITTLVAQNSVAPRDIGVASSSRTFFQQIGGSIGVAGFGAIFAHRLTAVMSARLPAVHLNSGGGQLNPVVVAHLPALVQHVVFAAIAQAIQTVFFFAAPAAAAVFILAWFIQEVPLRGRGDAEQPAAETPELVG